jgi:hypothetical protein
VRPARAFRTQADVAAARLETLAAVTAGFYFVRWLIPGQEPKGSWTFNKLRACRSYARRALLHPPTWSAEIVHHQDGEQTVVQP